MNYDPAKDARDSYYAAIEAKRLRGDAAIRKEVVIGDCRLLLGDCRDILPSLNRVDAVVTDPPYGIGESSKKAATRGRSSALVKRAYPRDYGGQEQWDQEPADAKVIAWMRENSDWQIIFERHDEQPSA